MIIPGIIASSINLGGGYWAAYLADSNAAGSQNDNGSGIATDSTGNVYVTGYFYNASSGYNVFITKYNTSGTIQWQRSLADSLAAGSQYDFGNAIATDSSGNVYVTGRFYNASLGTNAFITKYNTSGTIQWQRSLKDSRAAASQNDYSQGIATDSSGNVYVTGFFSTSSNGQNVFITKYNTSGTIQWQRSLADSLAASSQSDWGNAIATDSSGNVYVTGYFSNSSGSANVFITKYNTSGTIQWQRSLADSNAAASQSDVGYGIATDSSGNVYVTGSFYNASNGQNVFITKYDTSGTIQWQRSLKDSLSAGSQNDNSYGIATDSTGNVYVTGDFKNSSSGFNAFITKYNTSGTIQWQRSLADSFAAGSQSDYGYGIATDSTGNVYVSGRFKNSSGSANVFITKLPNDGTKTGTWTIDATHILTYATSSLTDAAGSLTAATSSLTAATSSLTDAASSLTDAAGSLTGAKVTL